MSKQRYFLKELVNNKVFYADGTDIPFIHGADDMGYLALDATNERCKEIDVLISKRRGGIYETDEATYNAEKKKLPWSRLQTEAKPPRLFNPAADPFSKPASSQSSATVFAQPAVGQADARHVVDLNPAQPVEGPAKRDAAGFKPRKGRANQAK